MSSQKWRFDPGSGRHLRASSEFWHKKLAETNSKTKAFNPILDIANWWHSEKQPEFQPEIISKSTADETKTEDSSSMSTNDLTQELAGLGITNLRERLDQGLLYKRNLLLSLSSETLSVATESVEQGNSDICDLLAAQLL